MDFGLHGKTAVICASSKGLGYGCAEALGREGVSVTINGRDEGSLEDARKRLEDQGITVNAAIAADVTTEEGRAALLQGGIPDILVNNAGGPPPGSWRDWGRENFMAAIEANMLAPILMCQAVLPEMTARKWGRIINITSQSVRAPIPILGLSNTARTGLTGYVAGIARQVAQEGVTINNLLPGIHDTDRATALDTGVSKAEGVSIDEARKKRESSIPAQRYGTPEEFGAACAFLASDKAGFIVGQNLLLDGGATNLTM
ncbi:SDR family oxidoreductase [Paracoccaceae bacterium GXU_MW_L88]